MRPDFSDIIDVIFVLFSILFRNNLNVEGPRRVVPILDCFKEILSGVVFVLYGHLCCLLGCEVFNSLVTLEMVLDKEGFSLGIDPLESM
jgi:hypothetical protein